MKEEEFRQLLSEALEAYLEENNIISGISSFSEKGLLTLNEGLVVRTEEGSEFQLTIVKTR